MHTLHDLKMRTTKGRLADALLLLSAFYVVASCEQLLNYQIDSQYDQHEPRERSIIGVRLLEDDKLDRTRAESFNGKDFTPVVMWHGMGDSADGSIASNKAALRKAYPGMSIFSIQIGKSVVEDILAGYFVNVNQQIEEVCSEILANKQIKAHGSFNAIGFSQGGQFLRGLIQRCPFRANGIKVKNFISLGGQHQGVFGLPRCNFQPVCDPIRKLLHSAAYTHLVQQQLVQAEYWHDPHREQEYQNKSLFLADINNENKLNLVYRDNLIQLDNLVLVQFLDDDMVIPRESSIFGFYQTNDLQTIVPLEKSRLYLEDRIGLKQMNEQKRLKVIKIPGLHLQYSMSWFMHDIASVYLDN